MSEIIKVGGFSPESLTSCVDLGVETKLASIVFTGLASVVHDDLVDLYDENTENGIKYYEDSIVQKKMENLGFDLKGFYDSVAIQQSSHAETVSSYLVTELVEAGRGVDWHRDIISAVSPREIIVPFGFGFSVNLDARARFCVDTSLKGQYEIPNTLNRRAIEDCTEEATSVGDRIEADDYSSVILDPGDVIMWRQPIAHRVSIIDEVRNDVLRKAIVIIAEDCIRASDELIGY